MKVKIKVDKKWFDEMMLKLNVPEQFGCPFCGHTEPRTIEKADDGTFFPRRGCLECNQWFELPELKP